MKGLLTLLACVALISCEPRKPDPPPPPPTAAVVTAKECIVLNESTGVDWNGNQIYRDIPHCYIYSHVGYVEVGRADYMRWDVGDTMTTNWRE